jgi:hypothetical protein
MSVNLKTQSVRENFLEVEFEIPYRRIIPRIHKDHVLCILDNTEGNFHQFYLHREHDNTLAKFYRGCICRNSKTGICLTDKT